MDGYKFRINAVELKDSTHITLGDLTVVVGPNNSGKSRLLRDVEALITQVRPEPLLLNSVDYTVPQTLDALKAAYPLNLEKTEHGSYVVKGLKTDLAGVYGVDIGSSWEQSVTNMLSYWDQDATHRRNFASWFGQLFVTRLRTEDRLLLTKKASRTDENSILAAIYDQGTSAEEVLTSWVYNAFSLHVKLDYSSKSTFVMRVGSSFANVPQDPREALPVLQAYSELDDQGDGLRSFAATAMALIVNRKPVLLLDEPEAFLHPPQAVAIGQVIADVARSGQQVIVATHSSDVLRGVLSRRSDIGLIRIARGTGQPAVTVMRGDEVAAIASNPLLSSSRVLEGLFYKAAVIVEADADSSFYQRVARRVRPGDEIHYAHAHNKQTLAKIAIPYKRMGLPVAVVPDFDVLRNRAEFKPLLESLAAQSIDQILQSQESIRAEIEGQPASHRLTSLRQAVEDVLESVPVTMDPPSESQVLLDFKRRIKRALDAGDAWTPYKQRGKAALSAEGHAAFDELDVRCREVGLFIVPVGELESWLLDFGVPQMNHKGQWIVQALSKLADLELPPESPLSKFVCDLHAWLLHT